MRRAVLILLASLLLGAGLVAAQSDAVTPTPGPIVIAPRATVNPIPTGAPADSRLTVCRGPLLEGLRPYIIRRADRLGDLIAGLENVSVTQMASINCIDDPAALPVGAVVWLPENAPVFPAAPSEEGPGGRGRIVRFEADSETVSNQVGVTFEWVARGEAAYFYSCPPEAEVDCPRPEQGANVSLAGSATFDDLPYAGPLRYRLEVIGGESVVTEDVTIAVVCSQESLGPVSGLASCPKDPARTIFASWQPFEGGAMMWFSDTDEIWVLTNADQRVQIFNDIFQEGDLDSEIIPPPGLQVPNRGFGQIWAFIGGADGVLGWGITPSLGFDSARQTAGDLSFTTYIQGPGETVYAVTIIDGTDVAFWSQVAG